MSMKMKVAKRANTLAPKKTAGKPQKKKILKRRYATASSGAIPPNSPKSPNHHHYHHYDDNDDDDDDVVEKGIPKAPFARVVKEVTGKEVKSRLTRRSNRRATAEKPGVRFQKGTIDAVQAASEAMLESVFKGSALCAQHCGRKTVKQKDMEFFTMMMSRNF